jgi:hypothetical protein
MLNVLKKSTQNYESYQQNFLKFYSLILKFFLLNQKQLQFLLIKMDLRKILKTKVFKTKLLSISPIIFTEFIKNQLKTSNKFNNNLQRNIINFVEIIFKNFKYDILGLKIICAGK